MLRSEQTTLHVYVFDHASTSGCARGTKLSAMVSFDDVEIAQVAIVCGETASTLLIDGPKVSLGLHELTVRAKLPNGEVEASSVVSLPAIDVSGDGKTATLGAELLVEMGADEVVIGPPQVYPPK